MIRHSLDSVPRKDRETLKAMGFKVFRDNHISRHDFWTECDLYAGPRCVGVWSAWITSEKGGFRYESPERFKNALEAARWLNMENERYA